jgi:hypothetical protein
VNLDEMEALQQAHAEDEETEAIVVSEVVYEEETNDRTEKLMEDVGERIMRHLYGANGSKMKAKATVIKILAKYLGAHIDEIENDLGETLSLLEDSLRLHEQILGRHAHSALSTDLVSHMEELSDWLSNWGMGEPDPRLVMGLRRDTGTKGKGKKRK